MSIDGYQAFYSAEANREQQRARLSFGIELEKVDDPTGFRIVAPLQIGGTTDARHVTVKNYVTTDKPAQFDFLSTLDVDWNARDGHVIGNVASTEKDRQLVGELLSRQRLETIASSEESLYVVMRLQYCDTPHDCYYFMRCAELGSTGVEVLRYCGTRSGMLPRTDG